MSTTTMGIHCPGNYGDLMPPATRRTKQRTVGVDDELWSDCLWIARKLRRKLSDVIRGALLAFRDEHAELLVDKPASPGPGATDA